MAKTSTNKISNINVDWALDPETGLPFSGEAVQEFIKDTFKSKYGYFHYDELGGRYMVFSDQSSCELYLSDKETYRDLLLTTFDAPFNYSAEIHVKNDEYYKSILLGTKGNTIEFSLDIKNKSGISTNEIIDCTIVISNGGIRNTINRSYSFEKYKDYITEEIDSYLIEGTNNIVITATGRDSMASITTSIIYQVVNLNITDQFNLSTVYDINDSLLIPVTVSGTGSKVLEWYIDGELLEYDSEIDLITSPGSTVVRKSISLHELTPGLHSVQYRVRSEIGGNYFYTPTLFRNFFIRGLETELIGIATEIPIGINPFNGIKIDTLYNVTQYIQYQVRYAIYNPSDSRVNTLYVYINDELYTIDNPVNGKESIVGIIYNNLNTINIKFELNNEEYSVSAPITEASMDIYEITRNLVFDLRAFGRNNQLANREEWTYGDYTSTFDGFYWNAQSGWVDNSLIVNAGATLSVNYAPLKNDATISGKTMEFEFSTRNVVDDSSVILDLTTNNCGIKLTASEAILTSSDGQSVSTRFKSGENNRIAFVINPSIGATYEKLMFIYVNGVICGAINYGEGSSIISSKNLVFHSDCDIILKHLRFYDVVLDSDDILNNYILYQDSISEMLSIYNRNNIYDDINNIDPKIMENMLPVMYFTCLDETENIPWLENQFDSSAKDIYIYCDVDYVNMQDPTKNFHIDGSRIRIQGTSSIKYPKKNWRFYTNKKNSDGVKAKLYDYEGNWIESGLYAFKDGATPVDCWCLKADYAESSSAHNTGVSRLWNNLLKNAEVSYTGTVCPEKNISRERALLTTAQSIAEEGDYPYDVRTTIDGFPIVLFYRTSINSDYQFLGKYNFNNDKSTESVFGFCDIPGFDDSKMQCWEILNNGEDFALFKTTENWDTLVDDGGKMIPKWEQSFEARYPDQGDYYDEVVNDRLPDLKAFADWVINVSAEDFVREKWDHFDMYKMAAYYIYLMRFGATDQVAKNSMFTSEDGQHFYFINYDNDTVLGVRNDGRLVFDPTIDRQSKTDGSAYDYAGHDSVLWNKLEADEEFMLIVNAVDDALVSAGLTYDNVIDMFEDKQTKQWCERIYNKDAQLKYLGPYYNGHHYLLSLQGNRNSHRRWWLSQRFSLYDAKFISGSFKSSSIVFKANESPDTASFTITSGKDLPYGVSIVNGKTEISDSVKVNDGITFNIGKVLTIGDPTSIYNAANIKKLDLSGISNWLTEINFTAASSGATSPLMEEINLSGYNTTDTVTLIGLNGLPMLKKINISGIAGISELDLSGLLNIQSVIANSSGLSSLVLEPGCLVEELVLPNKLQALSLHDLPLLKLSGLSIADDWMNVRSINISGCAHLLNDFTYIWNWFNKTSNVLNRSLVLDGVNWENVSIDDLIALHSLPSIKLLGTIKLRNVGDKYKLLTLRELYGDNIFNKESDLYIYGPDAIYLFGDDHILEGESVQYEWITFSSVSGVLNFGIIGESRTDMSIDGNGLLTTLENGANTTNTIIRVQFRRDGSNVPLFDDSDLIVEKRIYPESITIDGSSRINTEISEFSWITDTTNITGEYIAEWSLDGSIINYVSVVSSDSTHCVIRRDAIPENIATGVLNISLYKKYNNELIATSSLIVNVVNPEVIMTYETNPKVLDILYNAGLCPSNQYLLRSDAKKITSFNIDGQSIFANSTITNFDELVEFTGISELTTNMFSNCRSLESLIIPDSVTTISAEAFLNCIALESIIIPKNVSALSQKAFSGCENLIRLVVDANNVLYWSGDDGCIYKDFGSVLYMIAPGLREYIMPDAVIRLDSNSTDIFHVLLERITFNDSITGITGEWWGTTTAYKVEEFLGSDNHPDYSFVNGIVYSKDLTELISYPRNKVFDNSLFSDTLVSIGDYAFYRNSLLDEVILPESLSYIGKYAFDGSSVKKLTIPENVITVGERAFEHCTSLTDVSILGDTYFSEWAFYTCTSLTNVTCPNLTEIGTAMFHTCTQLKNIEIPNTVTKFKNGCFRYCSSLTKITIPEGVTNLEGASFYGCYKLSEITCLPLNAPGTGSEVFGSTNMYTGMSTGVENKLFIKTNAVGYDSGQWLDPLCNPNKCNFTINAVL